MKRGDAKSFADLKRMGLPVKESEIIDLLYPDLKEEILKVTNIGQGQYQRKAYVAVGNGSGLIGLGKKCAENDKTAIIGARRNAKLSLFQIEVPPNGTVPRCVTGQFSSVDVKLEPWILSIVASPMVERIIRLAGFTAVLQSGNCENATGPLVDAVFDALHKLKID